MIGQFVLFIFVTILLFCILFKLYLKVTTGWCTSKICLVGKTAIVTGANTGIGYETALDFAKRGARVILACRNERKAEKARAAIVEETCNENVVIRLIDMACFDSVRTFAKKINESEDRLDILVNNAGIGFVGEVKTKDGHDLMMQVNYFSIFLLTHLLIGLVKKTKRSRIVNVSSFLSQYAQTLDVKNEDLLAFSGKWEAYPRSKLYIILFTIELARKLKGTDVTTYSLHPGVIDTEVFRHFKGVSKFLIETFRNMFFKTIEEGAQTTIYCAVTKGIEKYSGEYFLDCRRSEQYKPAAVPGLPKKLWEVTEDFFQFKSEKIVIRLISLLR